MNSWTVTHHFDSAAGHHQRRFEDIETPTVWVNHIATGALILGSSQPDDLVDTKQIMADGLELARRRSGGGLVYIDPQRHSWLDVIIPSSCSLWDDDVARSFGWLGNTWVVALDRLMNRPGASTIYDGPYDPNPDRRLICFASLGPGEVTVADHKVIGISQRRTKNAAKFQCLVIPHFDDRPYRTYLGLPYHQRLTPVIDTMKVGLEAPWSHLGPELITDQFVGALPQL